jgi:hypothetical protein
MGAMVAGLTLDARAHLLLTQLCVYLLRDAPPNVETEEVRAILKQIAGPAGEEDIMNAGDQLIEQGRAKGETDTLRAAVAVTLTARGLGPSDLGKARLAACSDVTLLTAWLACAATAATEADVFAAH